MNRSTKIFGALLAAGLTTGAHAAQLAYTWSGTVSERFNELIDDPSADLLGVPRASVNDVDFSLRIVVDTDAARSGSNPTIYEDAIVSAALTLNGVSFSTLRRPSEFLSGAVDESEIRIIDSPGSGSDAFVLTVGNPLVTLAPPLFTRYTVPFNQTIFGTAVENAEVYAVFNSVNITGRGLFDSSDLPTDSAAFADATTLAIGMTIFADFGLFNSGSILLEAHDASFTVSAVPLPGAVVLFTPAVAALALRRRRAEPA